MLCGLFDLGSILEERRRVQEADPACVRVWEFARHVFAQEIVTLTLRQSRSRRQVSADCSSEKAISSKRSALSDEALPFAIAPTTTVTRLREP